MERAQSKFGLASLKTRQNRGQITSMIYARRLGVEKLGPYAFEECMPPDLYRLLLHGPKVERVEKVISADGRIHVEYRTKNESRNVIALIKQLIDLDPTVQKAWLCHPAVCYISRMSKERGFCGYRNIQMMLHHALTANPALWHRIIKYLPSYLELHPDVVRVPDVLDLQDLIEYAWDMGYNSECRIETGGIKGTRKYIGTAEVEALLLMLTIPYKINTFTDGTRSQSSERIMSACDGLLAFVLEYFTSSVSDATMKVSHTPPGLSAAFESDVIPRVWSTNLAPLYLQRQGHSLTIVGIEEHQDGSYNLLVFDPAHKMNREMKNLLLEIIRRSNLFLTTTTIDNSNGREQTQSLESQYTPLRSWANPPIKLLDTFRRDRSWLLAHKAFETVQLSNRN